MKQSSIVQWIAIPFFLNNSIGRMMAKGLIAAKAKEADVCRQLDRFKRINDEVQKLKEKFAQWDAKE